MNGNKAAAIMAEVKKAVIGKDDCVEKILMAILGGGHVLMDDIHGTGFFQKLLPGGEPYAVYAGCHAF